MSAPPRPSTPTRPGDPSARQPQVAQRTERTLDSAMLLQGQGHVLIRHEGALYRLQTTRLGKLILTK